MGLLKVLVFLILIFPFSGLAEENTPEFNVLCRYLDKVKPSPDERVSGAEYVPGVDVNGGSVAPADLADDGPKFLNDPIIIPIQLDLLNKAGLDLPEGLFSESVLGEIKVFADGRVDFGGQDISDQAKTFCLERAEEHGQESANPLPSSDQNIGQKP